MAGQSPNMELFEAYFQRADVDRDGRISGHEAVAFLQASNLPRQVLAQIWRYADQNGVGFLGRSEFYNALKLVTVAQSKRELTPEIMKAALYGPASAKIPAPQISVAATAVPQSNANAEMAGQSPNMEQFEAYFQRADVDRDGRISGHEAVAFLQASNLPRQVLTQIWSYADQNGVGFLGRSEFYNALKLVTVAQSKRELTPEIVKAALYGNASSKIPAPQINVAAAAVPQSKIPALYANAGSSAQLYGPAPSEIPASSKIPALYANAGPSAQLGFPPPPAQSGGPPTSIQRISASLMQGFLALLPYDGPPGKFYSKDEVASIEE